MYSSKLGSYFSDSEIQINAGDSIARLYLIYMATAAMKPGKMDKNEFSYSLHSFESRPGLLQRWKVGGL